VVLRTKNYNYPFYFIKWDIQSNLSTLTSDTGWSRKITIETIDSFVVNSIQYLWTTLVARDLRICST